MSIQDSLIDLLDLAGEAFKAVFNLNQDQPKRQKAKYQAKQSRSYSIPDINKMTGREFEVFLYKSFKEHGYSINLTPETQDYGADLIIFHKNGFKTVVQVKRSSKPVSLKAVQEVVAAIKHYKANRGMVITNNDFTKSATELAESNGVKLWDRARLMTFITHSK